MSVKLRSRSPHSWSKVFWGLVTFPGFGATGGGLVINLRLGLSSFAAATADAMSVADLDCMRRSCELKSFFEAILRGDTIVGISLVDFTSFSEVSDSILPLRGNCLKTKYSLSDFSKKITDEKLFYHIEILN